jgi:membrane protein required for colicin V production
MNSVDLIVLVVVTLNGLIGAFRGFTWQVFRLGSVVLAFWLGTRFAVPLADGPLEKIFGQDEVIRQVCAWVGIFVVTYLVMTWLGYRLRTVIDRARLTSSDRSLGFLVGSLKGVLFVALAFQVLIMFMTYLPDSVRTEFVGDRAGDKLPSQAWMLHMELFASRLSDLLPPELEDQIVQGLRRSR